jgi:hypothetical protein
MYLDKIAALHGRGQTIPEVIQSIFDKHPVFAVQRLACVCGLQRFDVFGMQPFSVPDDVHTKYKSITALMGKKASLENFCT